jgi:hypothetical protein
MNDLAVTASLVLFSGLLCVGRECCCRRWRLLGVTLLAIGGAGIVLVYCAVQ